MGAQRTAFFVSDRTAITAETLGHSLLTQFEELSFRRVSLRFIDTVEKAEAVRVRINRCYDDDGAKPLVFSTLVDPETRAIVRDSHGRFVDFFDAFISPLEEELGMRSSHAAGRSHGMNDVHEYSSRIDAINFSLNHDDGSTISHLDHAEVILIGISRVGKTPTCLYLSMHYGIRAANFPLTEDDLEHLRLPATLRDFRQKLFGLNIDPLRLQQIRQHRLPNSRYASLEQCEYETRQSEALFRKLGLPYVRSTMKSIEEIATNVIDLAGLQYRKRAAAASGSLHG